MWALFLGLGALAVATKAKAENAPAREFDRYDFLFKKYGRTYSVPWRWLKAIAIIESSLGKAKSVEYGMKFPSDADGSKSSDGKSWGLMQLTLPTAQMFGPYTVEGLNNPDISVKLAAQYLNWVIKNYSPAREREFVIRAYNGGPGWKKTKLGPSMTQIYYEKFLRALSEVLLKNPGSELSFDQ